MPDPTKPKTWRDALPIHPAANMFPPMTHEELVALRNDIAEKGMQVPVILYDDNSDGPPVLLDGRNRLDAMEMIGIPVIDESGRLADVRTQRVEGDPDALVVSLNLHRRHLTAEQRRGLIAQLVKADPSKSDRQIASMIKASPTTVGTIRAEMESAGDVSKLDTRRDSKGRNQPTSKPKKQRRKPEVVCKTTQELLNPLHWSAATPENRCRFLDAVGLDAVWGAIPPAWWPELERRIENRQTHKATTGDLSSATCDDVPPLLRRVQQ